MWLKYLTFCRCQFLLVHVGIRWRVPWREIMSVRSYASLYLFTPTLICDRYLVLDEIWLLPVKKKISTQDRRKEKKKSNNFYFFVVTQRRVRMSTSSTVSPGPSGVGEYIWGIWNETIWQWHPVVFFHIWHISYVICNKLTNTAR